MKFNFTKFLIFNFFREIVTTLNYCIFFCRAFPTNAATMGTVTLILKAFSDEEINVYDAMNKVQKLDAFKFDFPPVVENYFEHSIGSKSGRGMAYHHNVSTIATSGCQIFHIARPNFGFSKEKLYVEKMLFAMPSYHDEGKVSYFLLHKHSTEIRNSCFLKEKINKKTYMPVIFFGIQKYM